MSADDKVRLLNMFGARLSEPLAFSLSPSGSFPDDHPLAGEITAALDHKAASLPYPRGQDVMWVTLAPSAEELRRVIEDLRCWVLPSFGWEGSPSIVSKSDGAGQIGSLLLAHSPQGYFRWHSRPAETEHVIARLATMRAVISRAPARKSRLRPTLEILRRQFTLALATGDRAAASQAIEEIDRRQLDAASNSLAMRIRLAAAFGDDQAIVNHPQLDDLLSMRVPQRVIESVLLAHHAVYLSECELSGDVETVLTAYRPHHDRLAGLASQVSDDAETPIIRMAAYDSALAGDAHRLHKLATQFPADGIVAAVAATLPTIAAPEDAGVAAEVAASPESPDSERTEHLVSDLDIEAGQPSAIQTINSVADAADKTAPSAVTAELALPLNWSDVPSLLGTCAYEPLAVFLQKAAMSPDDCDPGEGDFVVELFTDASILEDPEKRAEAEQVLTTVIDAYVCEERFPRRERLSLYQAVLDVWSSTRALSTDPIDGQLLLTIANALLRLDGDLEAPVAIAVTRWWEARPVRSRLTWLGEALELLSEESVKQDYLTLWYNGAALIKIDHEDLSITDRQLWHRLGRRLGLDVAATEQALGTEGQPHHEAGDPLAACSFKKIAIVSLNERAAREAASQIKERTKADVLVVTDHTAGEGTASAATADVILFVWGAAKHAVYRAFDRVRDRLEYVQGTGSASIVRALERRACSGISRTTEPA